MLPLLLMLLRFCWVAGSVAKLVLLPLFATPIAALAAPTAHDVASIAPAFAAPVFAALAFAGTLAAPALAIAIA